MRHLVAEEERGFVPVMLAQLNERFGNEHKSARQGKCVGRGANDYGKLKLAAGVVQTGCQAGTYRRHKFPSRG